MWVVNFVPFTLNVSYLFAEITAFSDRYAEFEALNTEILGVSVDSVVSWFRLIFFIIVSLANS